MYFKNWLLTEGNNIRFTGWSNNGTIIIYIDNKRYVFSVDPIYHYELQRTAKFKPWTALNKIKAMIKAGNATQVEPPTLSF